MAAPTVTAQAATLGYSSETLNGNITVAGVGAASARGFNVGLTTGYGTDFSESGTFSTGAFSLPLTGLAEFTTYHFRSFATNADGTGVSADSTFKTVKHQGNGTLVAALVI